MTDRIDLGDEARDTITGYRGVVIARTQWLTGCDRLTLQPPVDKEGKVPENASFDEPYLELVKAGKVPKESALGQAEARRRTGGPRPEPNRGR